MVNAPKLDVIRSRLDIFQEGCVSDKRSNWAQLVIICTSEVGMADKEPENVMKVCESRLVGFFISSLSVVVRMILGSEMNWVLPEEWLSQYSYQLPLSALHRIRGADRSKKLVYWLPMKYDLNMQSSNRRGKRWFYIIISRAIAVCNCTGLIQLSLLLLLLKFGFFKENDSHLRRIKYHPGKENVDSDKEKDCCRYHRK